jgi:hypothetical protein
MPDIDVKNYLDRLRKALPYVPPIPVEKIKALHKNGDLGEGKLDYRDEFLAILALSSATVNSVRCVLQND